MCAASSTSGRSCAPPPATAAFSPLAAADLNPYPGALLADDLERHAVQSLTLHRPALYDTTLLEPEPFVRQAVATARTGAQAFLASPASGRRRWRRCARIVRLRHVARSILP